MRKAILFFIVSILVVSTKLQVFAFNGVDPARAAAIALFSTEAKNILETQTKAQVLMTTGHVWIREEVEKCREFQQQFNDYLDTFQDVLSKCVQIYGVYYEVQRCSSSISSLNSTVAAVPSNAFAAAFSSNSSRFYRLVIDASIEVVGDIKGIVFDAKMTEHERFKTIENLQPKLRNLNYLIRKLTIAVRYTSLADVWREIQGRSYQPKSKKDICIKCQKDWATNYKKLKI